MARRRRRRKRQRRRVVVVVVVVGKARLLHHHQRNKTAAEAGAGAKRKRRGQLQVSDRPPPPQGHQQSLMLPVFTSQLLPLPLVMLLPLYILPRWQPRRLDPQRTHRRVAMTPRPYGLRRLRLHPKL